MCRATYSQRYTATHTNGFTAHFAASETITWNSKLEPQKVRHENLVFLLLLRSYFSALLLHYCQSIPVFRRMDNGKTKVPIQLSSTHTYLHHSLINSDEYIYHTFSDSLHLQVNKIIDFPLITFRKNISRICSCPWVDQGKRCQNKKTKITY